MYNLYDKFIFNLTHMQKNYQFLPMVQSFITKNMPHGGYGIVAKRLESTIKDIDAIKVRAEISFLKPKSEPKHEIILESCNFIKESKIELDEYCKEYIEI